MAPRARIFRIVVLAVLAFALSGRADASVIVLANQTDEIIRFVIAPQEGKPRTYQIIAGDVLPIPVDGDVGIRYESMGKPVYRVLDPNAVYYFFNRDGLDLVRRAFTPGEALPATLTPAGPADPLDPARRDAVGVIPVMILVDDEEPAIRRVWEARLRERVAEASAIFEHHCRLRFEVAAVGTWESDDGLNDFALALRSFENRVARPPGVRLVIGFTSQYEIPRGQTHLGGTRGPLHAHILIREWSQHISHTERLEVLVHELGHILGAAHSPDPNSVMRPLVGDRRSRARAFRIGFDPVNTLVLYLYGEQIRLRGASTFDRFSPEARQLLTRIYADMAKELPGDTSAQKYIGLLARAERFGPGGQPSPLVVATRHVVRAVTAAAEHNRSRDAPETNPADLPSQHVRLENDRLTDLYFRVAAGVAKELPEEVAAEAFLLGLTVALNDSNNLVLNATLGRVFRRFESPEERTARLAVLGSPTMHGRRDLAGHFVVSCAMATLAGESAAESAGLLKEQTDARGGAGFSFADLAADMAGAAFALRVKKGQISLDTLARQFTVDDYLPPPDDLPEGLSEKAFAEKYGSIGDPRFRTEQDALRKRILVLPGFARH